MSNVGIRKPLTFPYISRLIALILAGAWRAVPAPLDISDSELRAAAPSLLQSGAGALGWRRVAISNLSTSAATSELQQAYRLHTLHGLAHESEIRRVLVVLHGHGIDPILVKGWSIARLYPELGLRPYGDIDLCIYPPDFARAKALLKNVEGNASNVDLHCGFQTFDYQSWESLHKRSLLMEMDDVEIRVLSREDQLRLLCFHFLREGAWRPLWLCDVAVALESRTQDFDWQRCLSKERKSSDWFACAILLAHNLLDARLDGVPSVVTSKRLPRWLVPSVLREWNRPTMPLRHRLPIYGSSRGPMDTLRALQARWPNQIEGTIGVGGPFNEMPRLPFQLAQCFLRATRYLSSFP